jgi:hypothetical protein
LKSEDCRVKIEEGFPGQGWSQLRSTTYNLQSSLYN